MKKILIALTMIGTIHYSANAQNKTHNQNDKNYKVCKSSSGYYTCGKEGTGRTLDMSYTEPVTTSQTEVVTSETQIAPQNMSMNAMPNDANSMSMNNVNSFQGYYQQHNIKVSDDDMRAPYDGLPSRQWDGPQKNEERNLNVNQTTLPLPPSDGSNAR